MHSAEQSGRVPVIQKDNYTSLLQSSCWACTVTLPEMLFKSLHYKTENYFLQKKMDKNVFTLKSKIAEFCFLFSLNSGKVFQA